MKAIVHSTDVGGRPLTLETARLAKQADGAILVSYGDTVLLVTAVANSYCELRIQIVNARLPRT